MPYSGPYEEITLDDDEQHQHEEEQDPLATDTDDQVKYFRRQQAIPCVVIALTLTFMQNNIWEIKTFVNYSLDLVLTVIIPMFDWIS